MRTSSDVRDGPVTVDPAPLEPYRFSLYRLHPSRCSESVVQVATVVLAAATSFNLLGDVRYILLDSREADEGAKSGEGGLDPCQT
jgi:hypothetical protein